jgi:hypothetical protein
MSDKYNGLSEGLIKVKASVNYFNKMREVSDNSIKPSPHIVSDNTRVLANNSYFQIIDISSDADRFSEFQYKIMDSHGQIIKEGIESSRPDIQRVGNCIRLVTERKDGARYQYFNTDLPRKASKEIKAPCAELVDFIGVLIAYFDEEKKVVLCQDLSSQLDNLKGFTREGMETVQSMVFFNENELYIEYEALIDGKKIAKSEILNLASSNYGGVS